MSRNLFWLSDEQWARIEPHLPTDVRGVERADERHQPPFRKAQSQPSPSQPTTFTTKSAKSGLEATRKKSIFIAAARLMRRWGQAALANAAHAALAYPSHLNRSIASFAIFNVSILAGISAPSGAA